MLVQHLWVTHWRQNPRWGTPFPRVLEHMVTSWVNQSSSYKWGQIEHLNVDIGWHTRLTWEYTGKNRGYWAKGVCGM